MPTFPSSALKKGSEGSVKLQIVLAEDGHVIRTTILRSSGDPALDAAAQRAVSNWRMKPSAIRSSDLTKGRETIVEFKQEALVAAVYPDRRAYWQSWKNLDIWMFAPLPAYPLSARQQHHTGRVLVKATIGGDGRVASVSRCCKARVTLTWMNWRSRRCAFGEHTNNFQAKNMPDPSINFVM